jgi:phosphate transport system permease protein
LEATSPVLSLPTRAGRRTFADRVGDRVLKGLSGAAAAIAVVVILGIAYVVFHESSLAFSQFGLGFITTSDWNPVANNFGAASFIYGTAVSSAMALVVATPLSIAIALYPTKLAPRRIRRPVATLVDLLAAIPSVILGLWGIIVLGPVMRDTIEPALQSVLGWIPLFSGGASALGLLPAAVILTIMALPIVTSVTREVFETVPPELKEGAYALGATRWEMVKNVVLPVSRPGIVGAVMLGLGRAIGEAIAVTQVIGAGLGIHASLFATGDTLASRIASQFQGATSDLLTSSLFYLGAILLVIALIVNIAARVIIQRMAIRGGAS